MELNAAGNVNFDMGRYGIEFVASPRHADGIVITGPVSGNMFEACRSVMMRYLPRKLLCLQGQQQSAAEYSLTARNSKGNLLKL